MTLIAGVDIGNASTEVVLAEAGPDGPVLRWRGLARTRGVKGSEASLLGAARLLADGERALGRRCRRAALARLEPVTTVEQPLDVRAPMPPGPVTAVSGRATTPAGLGAAIGAHRPLSDLRAEPAAGPVVASVRADEDFERAAAALVDAARRGWTIVGVVAAGDEAVLLARRSRLAVPIVDDVDVAALEPGERIAVEVAGADGGLELADPFRLVHAFELSTRSLEATQRVARTIAERRAVALVHRPAAVAAPDPEVLLERHDAGTRLSSARAIAALRRAAPRSIRRIVLPCGTALDQLDDAFAIDLAALDDGAWVRRDQARLDGVPMAVLAQARRTDAAAALAELTGRPVTGGFDEPRAAAAGAATTPGAPPGAATCDLGAGTIDLVHGGHRVVLAGAGALLTLAVALALDVPERLAEQLKRRPSLRVQSPHLAHDEDGRRRFLDHPAPPEAVGRLCVTDGDRLLPFSDTLAPEEWRALRLALKRETIATNVDRGLRALPGRPTALVVAGGAALDSEVVRMLGERLGDETVVGRADVAGRLGTRGAVAWGLLLHLDAQEEDRRAA
jgi:hypothetical protein